MSASICIATLLLLGQGAKVVDQSAVLSDDLKQTLTLFENLKSKVTNEKDGLKLLTQLNEKLTQIAQAAAKAQGAAKTDDARAKLAVVRFQALSSGVQKQVEIETLAGEIATKYRESSALCPFIENLTFFQVLGADRYTAFDDILKKSKNPEVLASANLANYFAKSHADDFDINKFKNLISLYPKTKAGQRASRIYDFRTKMSLGAPMLDLEVELLSGYKLNINSLKGRVVVLDFWGFWCSACAAEMPEIKEYVKRYQSKIAWVGVNTDGYTKAYLTSQLTSLGANWQNSYAGSITGTIPMDLGIVAYPSKIIIDSFGIVRYVPSIRDWRPVLEEALSKA
jgi:thiol-disulfide isomerase/thioredoxin